MNIIVLLMIIGYFLVRPSGMGQEYTTIGLIIAFLAIAMYVIFYGKRIRFKSKDKNTSIFIACYIFWGYLLLHSWLNSSEGIVMAFKAFLSNMIIITIYFILLNDKVINYKFFRGIFMLIKITIVSWIITIVISTIIPIDNLFMFKLPIEGYETSGKVYFPFTVLYGFMTVGEQMKLPRLLSFYRESGIAQMIFIWYYFMLKQYNLENKINKIILIIGIFATFSTSGIFTFIFLLGLKYLIEKNNIKNYMIAIVVIIISFYTLFNAPYIGLNDKMTSHGESISTRLDMSIRGIEKFKNNPFGIGLYGDLGIQNVNINLISSLYVIGFIGFLLYINIYLTPLLKMNKENKKIYIVSVAGIFITVLLSQPLIDAPSVYLHLLANYGIFKVGKN